MLLNNRDTANNSRDSKEAKPPGRFLSKRGLQKGPKEALRAAAGPGPGSELGKAGRRARAAPPRAGPASGVQASCCWTAHPRLGPAEPLVWAGSEADRGRRRATGGGLALPPGGRALRTRKRQTHRAGGSSSSSFLLLLLLLLPPPSSSPSFFPGLSTGDAAGGGIHLALAATTPCPRPVNGEPQRFRLPSSSAAAGLKDTVSIAASARTWHYFSGGRSSGASDFRDGGYSLAGPTSLAGSVRKVPASQSSAVPAHWPLALPPASPIRGSGAGLAVVTTSNAATRNNLARAAAAGAAPLRLGAGAAAASFPRRGLLAPLLPAVRLPSFPLCSPRPLCAASQAEGDPGREGTERAAALLLGSGPGAPPSAPPPVPPCTSWALPARRHLLSVCLPGRLFVCLSLPVWSAAGRARRGRRSPKAGCAPSGGGTMSRRKQTTPNKVNWEHIFAGLEEHTRQAMMKRDFPGLLGDQPPSAPQLPEKDSSSSDSEGDEETGPDEVSSPASEEDGAMATRVKKELDPAEQLGHSKQVGLSASPDALMGLSRCPLCQLECGSREQLITHVYQHTTAAVVSAKSYLCPVCGRALSSPGSLGRHLLIHSEDQLSNCAVCGARFTSHATFNSEKVPEVLCGDALPVALPSEGSSSAEEDKAAAPGPAVYPAGILLVCNSCVAYRKLLEAQAPGVRKWALRRQNEPLEVRLQRLERERTAKKSRRDNETPEEREVRRMRDREAKRLQRMQETDEQRARRLQRDREAMRLKRANETPEKRQARLIREREAKRLKRRLEKMDMMLRAQFGQDPSAMAALAAEMNFFPLPVGSMEIDSQLLGKMAFDEPSPTALH